MKNMKFLMIAVAVAGFSFIAGLQSCQSTKSATTSKMLKFNFEKGKGYDYEMDINMDQEIMGTPTKIGMTTYYSMDVKEDDGNIKTVQTKYDRFKMNMDMMGMKIDVDTDEPVDMKGEVKDPFEMVNRLFSAIKGQQFSMKINAEGKVLEVNGFKEMAESIISSLGLDAEEQKEARDKMKSQFDQQFNDKVIREQFERVLYIFPNKEVKVGDSWKKTTAVGSGLNGNFASTYTVTDIEGDMVTLDEKSVIVTTDDGVKLKGSQKGTLIVDSKTGLVVNADMEMDITATTNGIGIDMKGKTKIKGKARQ